MSDDLIGQSADQLHLALASVSDAFGRSAVAEKQSASAMSRTMSSADLKGLAKTTPDLNGRIKEMSVNAKTWSESARTRDALQAKFLKQLEDDLNHFLNKQPPVRNGG